LSDSTFDVAVIGAGIVGAACASECARERMRVVVVEADTVGGGATAAGMGHVVIMDDSEAQFALTRFSQGLWDELADDLPDDCGFNRCGTIWLAADAAEMDAVAHKQTYYNARDVATETLDARRLRDMEPQLRDGLSGALFVPGDSIVYPPCVARYLLERAHEAGAEVRTGSPVVGIEERGIGLADGTRIEANRVVDAAGSRSADLLPGLAVRPRKGHLIITDRYPGFVRHQLVELGYLKSAHAADGDSVAFNIQPRETGQCLIGSSRQYDGHDSAVDQRLIGEMLRRAMTYLPGLARLWITRIWTGFRAATPDALPLIGPVPGRDTLYLATGHEGLGITTALATARLLSCHFSGRETPIPLDPYLPSRLIATSS